MRALALVAVLATLAGCATPDSGSRGPTAQPTGETGEPECPPIQASFLKLNLTGLPGKLREATLVARPGESLVANDRPDCPAKRASVPLAQGISVPVENGRYHELRVASDVAVARVALDLPLARAGTLDVLLAPAAASARFEGARLLVTRAEIVEDPAAYSRIRVDASLPLVDSGVASRQLAVASPWNEGIHVSFGARVANGETADLHGLRAELRVIAPNGTLVASRAIEAARMEEFRVDAPAAGAWRIELDTTPPARPGATGEFLLAAVVDYYDGGAGANK